MCFVFSVSCLEDGSAEWAATRKTKRQKPVNQFVVENSNQSPSIVIRQ